jgi:hypothetical protein
MSGRPVAEKRARGRRWTRGEHPTVQEQGGTSPDHQHEGEEENEAKERTGPGQKNMEIEASATHDEEDWDEKTESDSRQLALDHFAVLAGGEQPNHDASGKGPQEDVQPELRREVDEEEDQQDRHPHR